MKKYYWTMLIASLGVIVSCEHTDRGESSIDENDKTPPGPVSGVEVLNVPGGAIISYKNPTDIDLLYVKAEYERRDGEVVEQKASVYGDQLAIEGFGKSRKVDVRLIAVDRNNNESTPVIVEAEPLDSDIYAVHNSVSTTNDFGGIKVTWSNPTRIELVVTVLAKDDQGEWEVADNFYTNSATDAGNVRGYPGTEREFGVLIEDRWKNSTDTIKTIHLPLAEERINPELFGRWNPPGIPYHQYSSGWSIEYLWDGNVTSGGYLFNTGNPSPWPQYPYIFTFDLGVEIKLSRFKIFQRMDIMWANQNVRKFKLWGVRSPIGVNIDYDSGWEFIGEFEIVKPSGLPLGQLTDEDVQAANAGHEFNADLDAPAFRYLRFEVIDKWEVIGNTAIGELQLWGEIQEAN